MATRHAPIQADAVLQALDPASAERAYLGLLPDRAHVDALMRDTLRGERGDASARHYAFAMALVGLRLSELQLGEQVALPHRQAALQDLRDAFTRG